MRTLRSVVTASELEQLARLLLHRDLVEDVDAGTVADTSLPEEQVGDHVEVVAQREVLVDGRDPERGRLVRGPDLHRLAVERCLAGVARLGAGDRLDQGRLAGAVVADERDDLARLRRRT